MFFQEAPPDTSGYMIAGYVIFFTISIIYVFSLAIRRRNLQQDLQALERLEAESRATARPGSPNRPKATKKSTRKK